MDIKRNFFSLRYIYRNALCDRDAGIIVITLPKVASTSWQAHILQKTNEVPRDATFEQVKAAIRDNSMRSKEFWPYAAIKFFRSSYVFATVRDPIERFISAHNMIITRSGYKMHMEKKLGKRLGGENFVNELLCYLENSSSPDYHFRPQIDFICAAKGIDIFPLGSRSLTTKLNSLGYENWLEGFDSTSLNQGSKAPVYLTETQMRRLKRYYINDYKFFLSKGIEF